MPAWMKCYPLLVSSLHMVLSALNSNTLLTLQAFHIHKGLQPGLLSSWVFQIAIKVSGGTSPALEFMVGHFFANAWLNFSDKSQFHDVPNKIV